ncbi:DUF4917 family protein [Paenarthrobacter sp. 4246]|uniref:DUF4917 family protein n=1 Tax=Paenarthrobacter sp. 4246 TaxID=3156456 RepID=UPI0033911FFB
MINFDEAISWASDGVEAKCALLLGNGFSMAYDSSRFSYGALATLAEDRDLLPPLALKVMKASGNTDFESLMRKLKSTVDTLAALDDVVHAATINELNANVVAVREALARSIAGLHPERPFEIEEAAYRRVRQFLDRFKTIYTVSYDLLLYWALMQTFDDSVNDRRSDDGFRDSRIDGDETVLWNIYNPYAQNVHYLHGALHLYRGRDGLRKITYIRTQAALIDQVRNQLESGRYPLYVAEGQSAEKIQRINGSAYLSRSLRSLTGRGNGLVVFGHSLDANDDHIFEAVIRSKVGRIAVSLHGDPDSEGNRAIQRRTADLVVRRQHINPRNPLEYRFFDASSVPLW